METVLVLILVTSVSRRAPRQRQGTLESFGCIYVSGAKKKHARFASSWIVLTHSPGLGLQVDSGGLPSFPYALPAVRAVGAARALQSDAAEGCSEDATSVCHPAAPSRPG
eukprot:gene15705-biopygen12679